MPSDHVLNGEGRHASDYDIVVLGAGVTGLMIAHLMAEEGLKVIVIEDYSGAGGNHISRNFGEYTFDIGSIFFHQGHPLFHLFPDAVSDAPLVRSDCRRICPDGRVRKYPFDIQAELMDKPFTYKVGAALDILRRKMPPRQTDTAAQFMQYYAGDRLLRDSGLCNYVERFYGLPADKVSFRLAQARMGWVEANAGLRSIAKRTLHRIRPSQASQSATDWRQFVRPAQGFSHMYDAITQNLKGKGVDFLFSSGMQSVTKRADGFVTETDLRTFRSDRLIATVPVHKMMGLLGKDESCAPTSIKMATLCVRFKGERGFPSPVLYNFHDMGRWKRLTMHSDFYGKVHQYEYFSLEIPILSEHSDTESAFADFVEMVKPLDVFDGKLELVGSFETDFSYPLYNPDNMAKSEAALAELGELGIETHGRQGNFDYIPSSALAIRRVLEAFRPRS